MPLSFYIALYDIGDSTTHHWALVALDCTASLAGGPVQMFQIVTQRDQEHHGEDGYMASHAARDLLGDEGSAERLLCLVKLPDLDMDMVKLEEFMRAQPVGRGSTSLIDVPWRRWECSQWAIRTIKSLIEAGVMQHQSPRSFFTTAAVTKTFWGPMLQVAGTKCAHDAVSRRAGGTSAVEIEIASLAGSGILL